MSRSQNSRKRRRDRRQRKSSLVVGLGATPQRLQKAWDVDRKVEQVVVSLDERRRSRGHGGPVRVAADGKQRVEDSVLQRLAARCALDRDPAVNRILAEAGERYYRHWYCSGYSGAPAMDPGTLRVDGGAGYRDGRTGHVVHHRSEFADAVQAIGVLRSAVLDKVVLQELDVETAGRDVSGYAGRNEAIAVGMTCLREGLRFLAEHFNLLPKAEARA